MFDPREGRRRPALSVSPARVALDAGHIGKAIKFVRTPGGRKVMK
jgi:hypothetical protein